MKKHKKSIVDLATLFVAKYKKAKIKTLVFDRYLDPFMVFGDFFSNADIQGHLKMLKKIFRYALSVNYSKRHPADIILYYETFSQVLNAAWVIFETGSRFDDIEAKENYIKISTGGSLSDDTLHKYLGEREIADPYVGFGNVFKKISLKRYHEQLNDWYKLSICKGDYNHENKETRETYRNIVKVLICCWLIYEREIIQCKV